MNRALAVFLALVLAAVGPTRGQTNTPPSPTSLETGVTLVHNDETDKGLAAANRIKGLMHDKRLDEALAAAQAETQTHPEHELAWYSVGDVLMVMQRYDDAIPLLQKCLAIDPKNGPALMDLGFCLAKTKQLDAAIDALSRAIDRMPDILPVWISLYQTYGAKNDIIGAEKKFEEYTVTYPKNPNAWFMLGQVQMFEQLPDSAIASWQKAIDLKPDFFDALKYLGLAYGRAGQTEKAIDCFARAAAIKPNAELVNNLGYAYLSLGQTDKAIEALKHALQLDPKYEKTLYNLTDAYSREKQWPLAWQTAHALAAVNPKSAAELTRNFPPEEAAPAAASPPVTVASVEVTATATATNSTAQAPPTSPAPAALTLSADSPVVAPSSPIPPLTNAEAAPSAPSVSSVTNAAPAAPALTPAAPAAAALNAVSPPAPPASTPPSPTPSAPSVDFAPPPSWVNAIDPDSVPVPASGDVEGGVEYLLIDFQQTVDPQATFTHRTIRLANEQGLEIGSDLRAEFDPNYQKLTINWLKVKRDGVWSDRLRADSFQLLHREENLDSQMLDGRYSAVCHLQDVRAGDLVDFAYTVTGANPVFGGKFVGSLLTGFPLPVRLLSNTLITPPNRKINIKGFGGAPDPVRKPQPDGSELLTWRQENVPATMPEPGTSPWYDSYGWVELTEFNSWQDVAQWGCSIFSLDAPLSPELQQEVDDIKSSHNLLETRAMAVVNFVQNDVRYLGVEMGENSYRPTPAAQVFERRFGDCKDKTQLCVTMLNALGIQADAALVSTTRGEATNDLLPSPLAFDHAIVVFSVNDKLYWADLTRTGQCGQLRDLAVSDFKRALLVRPNATTLSPVTVSPASLPQVTVDETYQVPSATDPATLRIHSVYRGSAAEGMRDSFNSLTHGELQKDYLDYVSRAYPQAKTAEDLRYQDFPDDNRCEVWQSYTVPGLWTRESPNQPYHASFVPFSIIGVVGHTTPMPRTAPFRIDYPADVTVNMELDLFDNWPLQALPGKIDTPNFSFTLFPSAQDNVSHFQYHYQALAPDVMPSGIADYNSAIDRVREQLEYRLTYTPGVSPSGIGALQPDWTSVAARGVAFSVALVIATCIYFIRREHDDEEDYYYAQKPYEGIGGWLICICIQIAVAMFFCARNLFFDLGIILNQARFDLMTRPGGATYDPHWAQAIYFEGCFSVMMLVFLILATILMLQKRSTFPAVMIVIMVVTLVFSVVDHSLVNQIAAMRARDPGPLPPRFLQTLISSAIWIPYLIVSKRVKATFRK